MSVPTNFNEPSTSYGSGGGSTEWRSLILVLGCSAVIVAVAWYFWPSGKTADVQKSEVSTEKNTYEKTKDEIRNAISSALTARKINILLVADYLNLDNEQDRFGRYLAEDFSALFTRNYSYFRVIDRSRLTLLLQEQNLNAAGLLDQNTVSNLGKIIGVQAVITGKYQIVGDYLKLWIKVIDIEKSELLLTKEARILIEGELKDAVKIGK